MAGPSNVLVVGRRADGGGASAAACPHRFVRQLVGAEGPAADAVDVDLVVPWMVSTKYYRAELALHVVDARPAAAAAAGSGQAPPPAAATEGGMGDDPLPAHVEAPQGMILVVDGGAEAEAEAEAEAALEGWRPWMDAASSRGLELCLCVGVLPGSLDGGAAAAAAEDVSAEARREEAARERTLWCLEYGFEYVEVEAEHLLATREEPPLVKRRLPEEMREAEGMDRVRECVESTLWPNLVRHSSASARSAGDGVGSEGVEAAGGQLGGEKESHGGAGSRPSVPTAASAAAPAAAAAAGVAAGSASGAGAGLGQQQQGKDVEEEEEEEEDLEALFDKIHSIRDQARRGATANEGGGAPMSDDERRARAAAAAMQLANALGLGDDDDEDC